MRNVFRGSASIRLTLALSALLLVLSEPTRTAVAAVTGRYDVALLRVRFTDTSDALYTVAELNAAATEMHDFFDQLSFGQLDLRIRVADVTVPGTWDDYLHCTSGSCPSLLNDAAERAAAGGFDFAGVEGILVVRAGCRENNGWTNGPGSIDRPGVRGTFQQSYDVECDRQPAYPSTVAWGGWAHELGHQLEMQDGRWALTHPTGYQSGYNLMDSCYPCGESAFSLADASLVNETGGVGGRLVFPGWLPASRVRVIGRTTSSGETVVLSPVTDALATTAAAMGVKIPIATGQYYFLEARRRLRADAWPQIYDEGIQILRIDESLPDKLGNPVNSCDYLVPGRCADGMPPDPVCDLPITPTGNPACWPFPLWHTGDTYRDGANNIAVRVGPAVGNGFAVTITRGVPPGVPDLYVTPWLTPPMHAYETVDLWVDSSCNGYEVEGGTLRYGRRADGTVVGNGDDPCVNHPNRLYARVRNLGDASAGPASITFEVSNPLGMGISGSWTAVGTASSASFPALASIPPGGDATVYVEWTPSVALTPEQIREMRFAFHSCFRVRAAGVPGERVLQNLDGDGEQENIDHFEVGAGRSSIGRRSERSFRLTNPADSARGGMPRVYSFLVDARLPAGWRYELAGGAASVTLKPGESRQIPVVVLSRGNVRPGERWHLKVAAYSMERVVPPRYVRTSRVEYLPRIAGGVEFAAQGVEETKMSLRARSERGVLVVEGRLDPAAAGVKVAVDYTVGGRQKVSRLVTTDARGRFRDATIRASEGWSVRAFWQGSDRLSSVVSDVLTARHGSSGASWPRWCIPAAILILLLLLLAWLILSRKRRRTA